MTPGRKSVHFSPKHTWEDKHRSMLSLLDLCFENQPQDCTAILNSLYADALAAEGFEAGMPVSSIVAQLHEYKNGGTGSEVYENLGRFSLSQLHEIFDGHLKEIKSTASKLKIKLRERGCREHEMPSPSPTTKRRKRRISVTPSDTTVTTWNANPDEVDDVYTPTRKPRPSMNSLNQTTQMRTNSYLPIIISPSKLEAYFQKHPNFLYRAFEVAHKLVARRFLKHESNIPLPPRFEDEYFSQLVRPHLERNKEYDSPFLSFTQYPWVAMGHAVQKIKDGIPMAVAIFTYVDLKRDAEERFGFDSGPYLVPTVVAQHKLIDLPKSANGKPYTGIGEFLMWGSVACEEVAIIDDIDVMMIRAMLHTTKHLDFSAGLRVNPYLPQTRSEQHLELLLCQLIRGYEVPGYEQRRKSTGYWDFIRAATRKSTEDPEDVFELIPAQHCAVEGGNEHVVQESEWLDDSDENMSDASVEFVKVLPVRPKPTRFPPSAWRSDTEGI